MDTSTSTRKCKKKSRKKDESGDRISSLPDPILHHILSCLPTKYAVATSVLSTKWKCLWTGVFSLDFCDMLIHSNDIPANPMNGRNFVNFVERVLLLQDAIFIHKFSLSSKMFLDASRVNAWITSVLRRKVQELVIHVHVGDPFVFPRSLFTCASFTVIKLHVPSILPGTTSSESFLTIPSSTTFPSLKVFHLFNVGIYCDHGIEVSLNLPMVEEIVLKYCLWLKIKTVNVFAPGLKSLAITDIYYDHDNKVEVGFDCEIKVYAESLTSLDFIGTLSHEFSFYNLSSLYRASIDICSENEVPHRASKLLEGIRNVTDLTLSDESINSLSDKHLTRNLDSFSNLKMLRISDRYAFLCGRQLRQLFSYLPNVESILFTDGLGRFASPAHSWLPQTIPQTILPQLKSVELNNFSGNENELCLIEFLLMNARALQIMTIISSSTLQMDPKQQLEVTKELLLMPRSYEDSVIDFS